MGLGLQLFQNIKPIETVIVGGASVSLFLKKNTENVDITRSKKKSNIRAQYCNRNLREKNYILFIIFLAGAF